MAVQAPYSVAPSPTVAVCV